MTISMKKQFLNFVLLLLLPMIIGGLLFISMGGGNSSGVRLFFLSLFGIYPTLKFILAKKQGTNHQKTGYFFVSIALLWWTIFTIHSMVLSASWLIFKGSIDSFFIVQAIANTTTTETLEFLTFHWFNLCVLLITLIILIGGYFYLLYHFFDIHQFNLFKTKPSFKVITTLFIISCVATYAIKPSRNNSPFIFWVKYAEKIQSFQQESQQHQTWHKNWLDFAKNDILTVKNHGKQTHLLVISESLTSKNLNVCGYPRNTTPILRQYQQTLSIYCQAYSRYPTTINAIKSMLTDISHNPDMIPTQSLLAYAKVAGFKTFWISNQDDAYLSSLFGSLADSTIYHNKLGGRSSFSIDEEIFPYLTQALQDNHDKKLIILHLIGSHPNYSARYPEKFNIFPNDTQGFDKINQQFNQYHIGSITKQYRDTYDNSVVYQDWVFGEIFQKIQQDNSDVRSFTFVSDHGNEVGHEKDYAGHSNTTEAGFQIPLIIWQNHVKPVGINTSTNVDVSLLDNYMLTVLGIQTKSTQPKTWADSDYQFVAPENFPYWTQH